MCSLGLKRSRQLERQWKTLVQSKSIASLDPSDEHVAMSVSLIIEMIRLHDSQSSAAEKERMREQVTLLSASENVMCQMRTSEERKTLLEVASGSGRGERKRERKKKKEG